MVRIFRVNKLEERRRLVLEQSDLNRKLLKVDVAGLKDSVDHLRASWKKWAAVAAIAGFLVARHGGNNGSKPGFFSRLASGFRMAGGLMSIVRNFQRRAAEATDHDGDPASRT